MSTFKRLTNVNEAHIIEVMEIKSIIGGEVRGDPIREISEYYAKDGTLLARNSNENLTTGEWKES